jgi:gmma-aminobutyric acid receptor subunit gamma
MGPQILKTFYSCTIESILTGCITTCYCNCSAFDSKVLQRVVRTAQYITGAKLPDIQDLYIRLCQRKEQKIIKGAPVTQVIDCSLCYRTANDTIYIDPSPLFLHCCYSLLLIIYT